jgi:hypothetical protein
MKDKIKIKVGEKIHLIHVNFKDMIFSGTIIDIDEMYGDRVFIKIEPDKQHTMKDMTSFFYPSSELKHVPEYIMKWKGKLS